LKPQNPTNSYKEIQIKTATPGKLIIMLYDGAIKFINQAIEGMSAKHSGYEKTSNSIMKAQDIITELMVSLDFDKGEAISKNLLSLYIYMNRRLVEANIQKDPAALNEVKTHLSDLRNAWAEAAQKVQTGPGAMPASSINIAG